MTIKTRGTVLYLVQGEGAYRVACGTSLSYNYGSTTTEDGEDCFDKDPADVGKYRVGIEPGDASWSVIMTVEIMHKIQDMMRQGTVRLAIGWGDGTGEATYEAAGHAQPPKWEFTGDRTWTVVEEAVISDFSVSVDVGSKTAQGTISLEFLRLPEPAEE